MKYCNTCKGELGTNQFCEICQEYKYLKTKQDREQNYILEKDLQSPIKKEGNTLSKVPSGNTIDTEKSLQLERSGSDYQGKAVGDVILQEKLKIGKRLTDYFNKQIEELEKENDILRYVYELEQEFRIKADEENKELKNKLKSIEEYYDNVLKPLADKLEEWSINENTQM